MTSRCAASRSLKLLRSRACRAVRIKFVLREFRFMSKLFGRGLLYIFVGVYYLNVVSGGVEGKAVQR